MQRSVNMAPIATPMAIEAARTGAEMKCAAVTPTIAATVLPPMIDQGWARGLDGTAKRRTAEAPIGAISKGSANVAPTAQELMTPVKRMPRNAPPEARSRSDAGRGRPEACEPTRHHAK